MFARVPAPLAAAVAALAILAAGATGASALGGGFLGGVSFSSSSDDGKSGASAALDATASATAEPDSADAAAQHETDAPDTDVDGFSDKFETLAGSDPNNTASTPELRWLKDSCADGVDNDGDGAVDAADDGCEGWGFDKPDADGDGFSDRFEQFAGSDPNSAASTPELRWLKGTCSDGADNDGDGAIDDADDGCQRFGFFDGDHDFDKPDSDGDGFSDWFEQFAGSDPNSAASTPEVRKLDGVCSDGLDNDGDGAIDDADEGCQGFGFFDGDKDSDGEHDGDGWWSGWDGGGSGDGDHDWNRDGGGSGDEDGSGGFNWGDGQSDWSGDRDGDSGGSFDSGGDRDWGR